MDFKQAVDETVAIFKQTREMHGDLFVSVLQLFLVADDMVDDCIEANNPHTRSYLDLVAIAVNSICVAANLDKATLFDIAQRIQELRASIKSPQVLH